MLYYKESSKNASVIVSEIVLELKRNGPFLMFLSKLLLLNIRLL
jgi:hypothetical protein